MVYLLTGFLYFVALEKWLAIASVGLFAMFVGEMFSIYNFMIDVPDDFEFGHDFQADPKILQFISISVAPAGVLAAVAFIMSRQYGSKQVGGLIVGGGIILLAGMVACYSMIPKIPESSITDAVVSVPLLFMGLSAPVMGFGLYLFKHKKRRPKKEYF